MTTSAIRKLLDARLITKSDAYDVFWEDTPWKPTVGVAHYRTTLLTAAGFTPGALIGSTTFEQGIYQIDVVTPDNAGPAISDAMCDIIAALFPLGLSLASSVRCWIIEKPARGSKGYLEGGWAAVPMSISYNAYLL
jgi:hypothetical protein